MTSALVLADEQAPAVPKKRYKMKIHQQEFMVTPSGSKRYPAGAVLLVDEDTAMRWYEHGVADLADPEAETYGEIERRVKREEFAKRARAVEGTFDAMVTRGRSDRDRDALMPPPMPVPGRKRRRDLEGAVINDISDEE